MSNQKRQLALPGFAARDQQCGSHVDSQEATLRSEKQAVYVLDVHYLARQVFHALPDIRSPSGKAVGTLHGFILDVVRLIEKPDAAYVCCAFDSPLHQTWRKQRYPAYKANREEKPKELAEQLTLIRRMLRSMGVPVLECPDCEADDILATVAQRAEQRQLVCFLVTGDKDCRQLISERVKLLDIRKGSVFDSESLMRCWGVTPNQVVDFQTLVGDAVDNIPGVPLIGPKTAQQLLSQYGTLDAILAHAAEISGQKRSENLIEARLSAPFFRELVRLRNDVPLSMRWDESHVGHMNQEELDELCDELGLHRLKERLRAVSGLLP